MRIVRIIVGEIYTNCYLLSSGKEIAIIDPGDEALKIARETDKLDGKVKYIINTHCHFDHTDGNEELKKLTGAFVLIHQAEKPYIKFQVDKYLTHGDEIEIGADKLKVLNMPGHTPGSICLLGSDYIFTGDLIFYDGYGRTDLNGGSVKLMKESLEKIEKVFKPGMKIYPGHGQIFQIALPEK